VRAVEAAEAIGDAARVQLWLELNELTIIEIEDAGGREIGEGEFLFRQTAGGKSGAVSDHSGDAIAAGQRDRGRAAGAAGKTGEVDATIINREAAVRVLPHGFGGVELNLLRTIPRIIRTGHDVAIQFRRIPGERNGQVSFRPRIEGVENWPAAVRRVIRGDVEDVALLGICEANHIGDDGSLRQSFSRGRVGILRGMEESRATSGAEERDQCERENHSRVGGHNFLRAGSVPARPPGYNARVRAPFEIIEHPADVGFIAYGATVEELFANAALAMMSLGCALENIEERERREIRARGSEIETLLYDWLTEILAIADAEQMVFRRAEVNQLGEGKIRGGIYGEKFERSRHEAGTYIKAVTYHQLRVEQTAQGWRAQVFLDV